MFIGSNQETHIMLEEKNCKQNLKENHDCIRWIHQKPNAVKELLFGIRKWMIWFISFVNINETNHDAFEANLFLHYVWVNKRINVENWRNNYNIVMFISTNIWWKQRVQLVIIVENVWDIKRMHVWTTASFIKNDCNRTKMLKVSWRHCTFQM